MGATAVTPAAPPRKGPLGGVSARLLKIAPDERLVALVRQGSQPAFEVVFDRHHRGILSFSRHMLGTLEEAEDATQHTFMAAYKALLESDRDIQLRAWLYTIARNRCLTVLRARREQPSDDIEIASSEGLAAQVQQREDLQDLLRDLAGLPEDQRAAIVLSELGDMGHDDIAAVLDCPKDKVKALVFQARSSLHQSRDARDTSCQEIREMISTLSGGSLRRSSLRRHVKACPGCQAFEADVKRQRRAMAAVLPVVPTLGFKESALAATFGQGAAGGAAVVAGSGAAAGVAAGGSAVATGGASALVAKVLVVAAVAGGGAAGVSAVSDGGAPAGSRSTPAAEPGTPSGGGGSAPAATADPNDAPGDEDKAAKRDKPAKPRSGRRRGQADRGKDFAEGRGKGRKRGLRDTQPGKAQRERAKARRERVQEKQKAQRVRERAKAKAKAKQRARRQRPAKPRPTAPAKQPQAKPEEPKPDPQPDQKPTPDPKPKPTPDPVPTAEPSPDATPGKGRPQL